MSIIEDIDQRRRLDFETCKFVMQHQHHLSEKQQTALAGFRNLLVQKISLTDVQYNYLDGMYEIVMGKLTGEKVNVHIDLKNKSKQNLRY